MRTNDKLGVNDTSLVLRKHRSGSERVVILTKEDENGQQLGGERREGRDESLTVPPEVPIQVVSSSSTKPAEGACSVRAMVFIGAVAPSFRMKAIPALRISTSYP